MSGTLREARKHAGIAKPDNRRASMHSFRFSLATHLLEDGVSWGTISSVMGHSNPDSTQTYAKASVQLLLGVALDTEEVSHA